MAQSTHTENLEDVEAEEVAAEALTPVLEAATDPVTTMVDRQLHITMGLEATPHLMDHLPLTLCLL